MRKAERNETIKGCQQALYILLISGRQVIGMVKKLGK